MLTVSLQFSFAFWWCLSLCTKLRPSPHVSGDFCIPKFFYADIKISASTRSVYESYTTVRTYPIRIRTSQRHLKGLVNRACAFRLVLILWRQRIQKYTDTSVHTYPDTQRIQKFPLWRAYTEISGYTERIRRTRVDARCIRIKKFADTSGRFPLKTSRQIIACVQTRKLETPARRQDKLWGKILLRIIKFQN